MPSFADQSQDITHSVHGIFVYRHKYLSIKSAIVPFLCIRVTFNIEYQKVLQERQFFKHFVKKSPSIDHILLHRYNKNTKVYAVCTNIVYLIWFFKICCYSILKATLMCIVYFLKCRSYFILYTCYTYKNEIKWVISDIHK